MTAGSAAKAAVEDVFASLAPPGAGLAWRDASVLYVTVDGTTEGLSIDVDEPIARIRAHVADRFQTIFTESTRSLIPACPRHPGRHPLSARMVQDQAMWVCPVGDVPIRGV
jgi:hypothetical protein